mmetsp:Transcript_51166/g.112064  ORF Transcript_51166/g.112064 Transcript_51166/m.112064 type:complete len:233 (-) Transcript_51166:51-749(-)
MQSSAIASSCRVSAMPIAPAPTSPAKTMPVQAGTAWAPLARVPVPVPVSVQTGVPQAKPLQLPVARRTVTFAVPPGASILQYMPTGVGKAEASPTFVDLEGAGSVRRPAVAQFPEGTPALSPSPGPYVSLAVAATPTPHCGGASSRCAGSASFGLPRAPSYVALQVGPTPTAQTSMPTPSGYGTITSPSSTTVMWQCLASPANGPSMVAANPHAPTSPAASPGSGIDYIQKV